MCEVDVSGTLSPLVCVRDPQPVLWHPVKQPLLLHFVTFGLIKPCQSMFRPNRVCGVPRPSPLLSSRLSLKQRRQTWKGREKDTLNKTNLHQTAGGKTTELMLESPRDSQTRTAVSTPSKPHPSEERAPLGRPRPLPSQSRLPNTRSPAVIRL